REGRRVACGHAAAVDKDQRAGSAQAAQVHRGRSGGAVGEHVPLTGENLRHVVEQVLDRYRMLECDVCGSDDADRAGTLQVRRHRKTRARTVSFSILSAGGGATCAKTDGADSPTRIPALNACATASDSFFLCIL